MARDSFIASTGGLPTELAAAIRAACAARGDSSENRDALLAALARHGHATGARHLWLTAKPGNTAAHAFYRRLGSRGETVIAFAIVEQDFRNLAAEAVR